MTNRAVVYLFLSCFETFGLKLEWFVVSTFEMRKNMFNRRMFVALAVCLVVSASAAFAGGGGGAKKDSTIKVNNNTSSAVYAFVDVPSSDISSAASKPPTEILAAFNALGGKPIAAGANASFSVKTGAHKLTVVNIDTASLVFVDKPVTTVKGQTSAINVQ